MANYMYLFSGGQDVSSKMSPSEKQKNMEEWNQWVGSLAQQGKFKSGEPLSPQAHTLKKNGADWITDGPFTEAKEMIGGYLIVEADSREQAMEMARGCPIVNGGIVEVREILAM